MAFACGYYCSFCKITLKTEKGWLNHLLSPDHQADARADVDSWDCKTKERVLVAFGKSSVATEAVLGTFGEQDGKPNLSGFVWNKKRPRVGLLLFETREKADAVLNGLSDGYQMRIGDCQLLQLRKATEYVDLEWEEHFAQDFRKELNTEFETTIKDETPSTSKRIKLSNSDESSIDSDSKEDSFDETTMKIGPGELVPLNLCSQFHLICRQMEVGDTAYTKALIIMEKCQRFLTTKYAHGQLYMFRHWYLKLRAQGANELLFYVDAEGVLDNKNGGEVSTDGYLRGDLASRFATSPTVQQIIKGIKRLIKPDSLRRSAQLEFGNDSVLHFDDETTKTQFTLVTDPLFAVEAQTCRLLNYLLDFDPRARPVLSLIFYWAEQNQVNIQGTSDVEMLSYLSYAFAPEPTALAWMVIFFLCHKGILPTPRELVERPRNRDLFYVVGESRINIGFRMDRQFAEQWTPNAANCLVVGSDQFVLYLVALSKEFFEFYGQLRSTSQDWVLNTRDGELSRKEDLLGNKATRAKTRLTKKELVRLRNSRRHLTKRHVRLNGLAKRRFIILHPLILEWTIPCDEDNFFEKISQKMLASANIIEIGLPFLHGNREDQTEDGKNMTTLQNLFRKVTL